MYLAGWLLLGTPRGAVWAERAVMSSCGLGGEWIGFDGRQPEAYRAALFWWEV